MNILVACELSGRVRDALIRWGHNAISCDILPSDAPGPHYQGDVRDILDLDWDMVLAFPPCTYLAVSGARWWSGRQKEQEAALKFVQLFMDLNHVPLIAIENPIGKISTAIRKPDQIIQPWEHGHGETKATCLWLKGLPLLHPSHIVSGREARIHKMPPGPNRSKLRSQTFLGIAEAMAIQWAGPAS